MNSLDQGNQIKQKEKTLLKLDSDEFNHQKYFPEIISNDKKLKETLRLLLKIAPSDSPILILGETGTGKDLIARAIHNNSNRPKDKLVTINCSAIPDNLFESELFGYMKGAFTGADKKTAGILESIDGGTLFLDEIGDMPLHLQVKLLRVLQEKKYTPIGSRVEVKTDIRFIAATNKNLEEEIKEKKFRLDLYYRLNVLPIKISPLRKRKEDIPLLFKYFSDILLLKNKKKLKLKLGTDVLKIFTNYSWPGNIRELYNLSERLCLIKEDENISVEDLPIEIRKESNSKDRKFFANESHFNQLMQLKIPEDGFNLGKLLEEISHHYIDAALKKTGNNKKKAAELLSLNRTTLLERLKKKSMSTA